MSRQSMMLDIAQRADALAIPDQYLGPMLDAIAAAGYEVVRRSDPPITATASLPGSRFTIQGMPHSMANAVEIAEGGGREGGVYFWVERFRKPQHGGVFTLPPVFIPGQSIYTIQDRADLNVRMNQPGEGGGQ